MSASPRPLLPVGDVAKWLHCSEKTVWRLLERGLLTKVKIGHAARVTPESVDAFIASGGR